MALHQLAIMTFGDYESGKVGEKAEMTIADSGVPSERPFYYDGEWRIRFLPTLELRR